MENTKIRVECTDGEIKEYEGKAIIGIVMDTDECEDGAIDQGFLVGRGNRKKMLLKPALVPESDKRPAITTAEMAFKEVPV